MAKGCLNLIEYRDEALGLANVTVMKK
jgi:hypothetical protein